MRLFASLFNEDKIPPSDRIDLTQIIDQIDGLSDEERIGYHHIYGTLLALAKRPVSQAEIEEQVRDAIAAKAHDSEIFRVAAARIAGFWYFAPFALIPLIAIAFRDQLSMLVAWGTWKLAFVMIAGLVLLFVFFQNRRGCDAALRFAAARNWVP